MNLTINNALDIIEDAISENPTHELSEAKEAMAFLATKSRFPAAAKARLSAIVDRYEELTQTANAQTMAQKLREARTRYVTGLTSEGNKSLHNGDDVAFVLEGLSLDAVLDLADKFVPIEGSTHSERYAEMNTGHARMNAGNKLRAAFKRGEIYIKYNKRGEPAGFKKTA